MNDSANQMIESATFIPVRDRVSGWLSIFATGWLGSECRSTTNHCDWPPSAARPQQASMGNRRPAGGDLPITLLQTSRAEVPADRPQPPAALRERVEKREVRGEQERNGERESAARRCARPLREDGYKRNDGCARTSSPLFFGLEGRPCIARGEPRFAAEPREYGRPPVGGRVPDNDSHRRAPSPQQPAANLAGATQRPIGCGLGTRRSGTDLRTRPRILARPVIPGLRPGSLCSPGLAPGYARSPAPRAAIGHGPRAQFKRT